MTRLLIALWWRFLVLTATRFTVMPVLATWAWLQGNEEMSVSVTRTWRIVAETPPPWALIAQPPETGGTGAEPCADGAGTEPGARTDGTPRPDPGKRRD